MNVLLLISMLIFTAYTIFAITTLKNIPTSYSNSCYMVPAGRVLFWIWATACPFLLLIPWINACHTSLQQGLAFLSCAALCFVGAAEDYLEKKVSTLVHYSAAIGAMIVSQLWIVVTYGLKALIPILSSILIAYVAGGMIPGVKSDEFGNRAASKNTKMFFLELAIFILVYVFTTCLIY